MSPTHGWHVPVAEWKLSFWQNSVSPPPQQLLSELHSPPCTEQLRHDGRGCEMVQGNQLQQRAEQYILIHKHAWSSHALPIVAVKTRGAALCGKFASRFVVRNTLQGRRGRGQRVHVSLRGRCCSEGHGTCISPPGRSRAGRPGAPLSMHFHHSNRKMCGSRAGWAPRTAGGPSKRRPRDLFNSCCAWVE